MENKSEGKDYVLDPQAQNNLSLLHSFSQNRAQSSQPFQQQEVLLSLSSFHLSTKIR